MIVYSSCIVYTLPLSQSDVIYFYFTEDTSVCQLKQFEGRRKVIKMTVSADINGTLSSVSWSDEQLYLKEFMHRHPLPAVVRIVKGQYCSLGVSR